MSYSQDENQFRRSSRVTLDDGQPLVVVGGERTERDLLRAHLRALGGEYVPQPARHVVGIAARVYAGDTPFEPFRTYALGTVGGGLTARREYVDDVLSNALCDRAIELQSARWRSVCRWLRVVPKLLAEVLRRTHREVHRSLTGEPRRACRFCEGER